MSLTKFPFFLQSFLDSLQCSRVIPRYSLEIPQYHLETLPFQHPHLNGAPEHLQPVSLQEFPFPAQPLLDFLQCSQVILRYHLEIPQCHLEILQTHYSHLNPALEHLQPVSLPGFPFFLQPLLDFLQCSLVIPQYLLETPQYHLETLPSQHPHLNGALEHLQPVSLPEFPCPQCHHYFSFFCSGP